MKLLDCLPDNLSTHLHNINNMRELRIRNGGAVKLNVGGVWFFLGRDGSLATSQRLAMRVGEVCDAIVKIACSNSVYAYERHLANGYFTLEDGVRVGVCGQVFGLDKTVFQRYTSLCFRIPHYVNCVSNDELQKFEKKNTLVLGAPGMGKTTFLRDLSVKLGRQNNVLVVDERGELFYDEHLLSDSGCDVLRWATKSYAFETGVRAMSPSYIICDELSDEDVKFVRSCVSSGVFLICSAHSSSGAEFNKRFGVLDCFDNVVDLNVKKVKTVISP